MIYKNYILSKKLGGLDIYISIFFVCFYYHCWTFFFINIITSLFFCKSWRLVNADCNFCVFIFLYYFYFNLVGINQNYMSLTFTYLLT